MNFTFTFSIDDINAILGALGNMPFAQVHLLVQKIQAQAAPQAQAPAPAAPVQAAQPDPSNPHPAE